MFIFEFLNFFDNNISIGKRQRGDDLMSDERKLFLERISLFLDNKKIDEIINQYNYDDNDFHFYHNCLNNILLEKNSKLKEKFVTNFYIGFSNSIIKNFLDKKNQVLDHRCWMEEYFSDLLIEMMNKDEVIHSIFDDPNKISNCLETITYKEESLLDIINGKMSKLKNCRIDSVDLLVENEIAMDLVEALIDCSIDLNLHSKKLIK